jgi:type II secretory pathway pseudopilin PulG
MLRSQQHLQIHRARRSSGFTIVEVLAVVGTIAILLGLLLAGLQAARRTSLKTVELNHLRQLHLAWNAYSATNNDYVIPGFLDPGTQQQWRLRYRFENGGQVPAGIASYYPWRLLPYMDWGYEALIGYSTNTDIIEEIPRTNPDPAGAVIARQLNAQPWFGYNGYYIGGWWEAANGDTATMRYSNGLWMQKGIDGASIPTRGSLVVRTVGRATNPSTLVLFAGSTLRSTGVFKESVDNLPGAAWCSPPRRGEFPIWSVYLNAAGGIETGGLGASLFGSSPSLFGPPSLTLAQGSDIALEVFVEDAVPYRRLSSTVSVVHIDGNTTGAGVGELADQRRWINAANDATGNPRDFRHTDQ